MLPAHWARCNALLPPAPQAAPELLVVLSRTQPGV